MQIIENVRKRLFENGLLISRTKKTPDILSLIELLRPVVTETPLIRLGGEEDGGYLVPDDLDGIKRCYSPGVYEVASFEAELANRGIPCSLADYSVDIVPTDAELISFDKKFISVWEDETRMRMESWVNMYETDSSGDLLLQMDIERDEYAVILDTPLSLLRRFRIVVIEFHDMHRMFEPASFHLYNCVFRKLLSTFRVVHIHPNNWSQPVGRDGVYVPPLLEMTFHRIDRCKVAGHANHFPHPLDRPNVTSKPDYSLPRCWFQ